MLALLGSFALAAAVATPASPDLDLPPLPPIVDDAPRPAPAPPPPPAPPPAPPAVEAKTPAIQAAPVQPEQRPFLLEQRPWLQHGTGSIEFQVTSLDGSAAILSGTTLQVTHDAWALGLRLATGGNDALGVTTVGARGSYTFFSRGAFDVAAGAQLGLGGATAYDGKATRSAALATLEPELSLDARLLPWAHAHAALSRRFVAASSWAGPTGDRLGGFGLTLGLVFGAF